MLEINPVIITNDGEVIALDAKVDIDDNAAFRQKAIARSTTPARWTHPKSRRQSTT